MLRSLLVARYGIRHFGGEIVEDLFDGRRLRPLLERLDEVVCEVDVLDGVGLPGALIVLARRNDEAPIAGEKQPGRSLVDAPSIDDQRLFPAFRRLSAEARVEEQHLAPRLHPG